MKYRIFTFFAFALLFSACNNELILTSGGDPIPVTYAIIDAKDTAMYIRLEKAFVDETIPPATLAQDPNNLYYDNASVVLTNSRTNQKYTFVKVDGNKEGYMRTEGAFAQTPNTLYKFKNQGVAWSYVDDYTIDIVADENTKITSITKLVEPAFLVKPNSTAAIDFDDTQNIRYSWNDGDNSTIHSMKMTINIIESVNNGPFSKKTLVWNVFSNIEGTRYEFAGKEFYSILAGQLTKATNTKRIIENIDVEFVSGGKSVLDYARVSQANLGITSSGEVPTYSNLSIGRGIYGSVAKVENKGLSLSRNTIDRLKNSELTKDLNFQ